MKKKRKAKRRGDGDGSIFQLADGRWRGQLSNGFGPNGKRRLLIREGMNRADVRDKLNEAQRLKGQGINITPERVTVSQFLDRWLTDVTSRTTKPKTHRSYCDAVKLHLKPALGGLVLRKLTVDHIQAFMNAKIDDGFSPKSVRNYRACLRAALNVAKRRGLIQMNAAELVEPPRIERVILKVLNPEEANRFLQIVKGNRLEALFTVAIAMGLRQGEALGLRWEDIDFDGRVLHVQRSVAVVNGEFICGDTKTASSVRRLGLPAVCGSALARHKEMQDRERAEAGDAWINSGFVFTTEVGTPLPQRTLLRNYYALRKAGNLPEVRFHDLRHSAATLLSAQGVLDRVIQQILGHSDIRMTGKYGQVLAPAMRDAADAMDRVFSKAKNEGDYGGDYDGPKHAKRLQ